MPFTNYRTVSMKRCWPCIGKVSVMQKQHVNLGSGRVL